MEWVYVSNFFGLSVVNAIFICLKGFSRMNFHVVLC